MQAFVLRVAPSEIDRVPEALEFNQIIIGWANADGLLDKALDWVGFREIVRATYYRDDKTLHRAGAAAGHLWRFIREMEAGDLVVVPYGSEFYLAEVAGEAIYLQGKQSEDSAYRRPVKWLNTKQPIPRSYAKSALISRMKIQGTSALATDLLDEIRDCLDIATSGASPSFHSDLQASLITQALNELQKGRIDSFGFENLIKNLLQSLGAKEARVVPRSQDKGADVVATFLVAETFPLVVAVQAKHWQPEPPVDRQVIDQLVSGMEAESADLGMVITTGAFSDDAVRAANECLESVGRKIELVDGQQFA
ncbi:restriction endonuclease [Halomonas piscis]|uniref:Restriction endonuclease n=1 Tax=Halomonas piscis TaxID=3031727 RepID=A0ABY9YXH1_9GAMM|nr:restriction endonuclease [Halomonas piscis]WNK19589.1 restriction endonuclease [Halomonas piscis]